MRHRSRSAAYRPIAAALAVLVAAMLSACSSGTEVGGDVGNTDSADLTGTPPPDSTISASSGTLQPGSTPASPPPANPAEVPGADRFGLSPTDDLCSAAPKVARAFVGVFDAAYAQDQTNLRSQVDDAVVGAEVLRTVAPANLRGDVDSAANFLGRFRDRLAAVDFNLDAAAKADPAFFQGAESEEGFRAMTAAVAGIEIACSTTF